MSRRILILAALLLAALAGACASPLDHAPTASHGSALTEQQLADLPYCKNFDLAGAYVDLFWATGDVLVAEAGGEPLCRDDVAGMLSSGVSEDEVDAARVDGTPLPAATGGESGEGTPLPAADGSAATEGTPLPARR